MDSMSGLRWRTHLRRVMFFGLTFLTAGGATALMFDALQANGLSATEIVGLTLFFCLFTWIAGALWTALAGFIVRLRGEDVAALDVQAVHGLSLRQRTAIVMPVYNEDTQRVGAGLESVWSSLAQQPEQAAFDLFVLSDSTDPEIARAEELMCERLIERYAARGRLHYRRRTERGGHKAGNIDDFVRRWGSSYDCMLILDADSVMSGAAIVTLAQLMEAHPRVGILQSLPLLAGHETLFGRIIQFGARLQSPMLGSGLAFWQLGDSNYWGHNAMVRLRPFAAHCQLPRLPGSPPFGGEILSHDFVEAALMRRAGFEVRQVPDLGGSWEEIPGNVLDYAARDRRWAQGNLQHLSLLGYPGLRPISRVHLLTGIMAYVSAPMWLILLLLSSLLSIIESAKLPQYFLPGLPSLFPQWPEIRTGETALLVAITLLVLLLPKFMGALLALRRRDSRHRYGGVAPLCTSLVLEQVFSVLLAPSMMIFHATFVVQTLLGRAISWSAQARGHRGVSFAEAYRRQKWQLLSGLLWGLAMWQLAPRFFWWLSPVLAGLISGIWLTVWTSRAGPGNLARRLRLFLVPEETEPPPELRALQYPPPAFRPGQVPMGGRAGAPASAHLPRRSS
jgi:membrane glycosyltransferase